MVIRSTAYTLLILLAVVTTASCTRECRDNRNSIGLAGFYDSVSKEKIAVNGLTVYGIGAPDDALILDNAQAVNRVYLPMPINKTSVQFVFHYTQKGIDDVRFNDTLTINYTPVPHFASKECGSMYFYEINNYSCTKNLVDSVLMPFDKITNRDIETVQMFMRTEKAGE